MPHLTLLGGALLEDEAGPISGPAARRHPLALLALLATAPARTRGRSKIVGLLWPESPEPKARERLNTCVHRVRNELGQEAVDSLGDDLRLDPEVVACDVPRFEAALEAGDLERAVDLYGGPFLDGFRLKGSPPFEKWVDRERERLGLRYREAVEALAENAEEDGDPAAAARWWRELARGDPYDSRIVRRLMEALSAAGNRAEALRVARTHERILEDEIGTRPSDEVRELAARLAEDEGVAAERPAGPAGTRGSGGESADGSEPPVSPGRAPGSGDAAAPPGGRPGPAAIGSRWRVAAALLLVSAAGLWCWTNEGGDPDRSGGEPVVAVLPFEAVGAADAGVFAEGMHGDLLTRLANVSGVDVIAATSVERYRDPDLPLAAIADSLGATWIVEGGVQQADGRIRVNAQLVDPKAGTQAWAESYRRNLTARDLFDLQGDITRNIVRSLEARLTLEEAERVQRRPTGDLRAYRSYLRGRNRLEERTADGTGAAAEHFRRAVRRDSSFALAWAGLAEVAVLLDEYGYRPSADTLAVGPERAVRRALALDSTLAEAHISLGYLHLLRAEGPSAVRQFRRAVELRPGSSGAHLRLGEALAMVGRLDATIRHVERAVELDPLAPFPRVPLGGFYHFAGRHGEALRQIRKGQELAPDLAVSHLLEGQALSALGRHEEAVQAFERGQELAAPGSVFARVLKAWPAATLARAGDTARPRELAASFGGTPAGSFDRAVVHAALGEEEEEALEALRRASLADHYFRVFVFRYAPVLDPLRDEPGYRDLVRRVNRDVGLEPDGSFPAGPTTS